MLARLRSLWHGLRRRSSIETEMAEEFRLHVELRARDLERGGLSRHAAQRNARREFGSTERYKEEARAARGLRRIDEFRFSWLDFKLGIRMLVKYPGLTIVGGLALAFAIFLGAGTFEFVRQVVHPVLPLPEGNRIVGVRLWHRAANGVEEQASFDFLRWREQVQSIEDLSAYRTVQRNLLTAAGGSSPVRVAQISASAFRVVRITPMHGRPLVETDELPGAPAVAVIGHDIWRTTFASDPGIVGRRVKLGEKEHIVVGVMPDGFSFPVSQSVWTPLKPSELTYGPRQGPWLYVFARLAPGVSSAQAQTEFSALGLRAAAEFPRSHQHLQPQVIPYAKTILNLDMREMLALGSTNIFALVLLFLICANVALLMFARAATRESEIVVRNALGASRARIITQLVAEALVLGALAALLGISLARFGLRWLLDAVQAEVTEGSPLPFWFSSNISLTTVGYAALLAVLCALIAGILPALKVTRAPASRLRQVGAGGGGLQFGGIWTVVIAAQVSVTVASPVFSFFVRRDGVQIRSVDVGFPDDEYLSVRMRLDRENPADLEAVQAGTGGRVTDSSQLGVLARFRAAHQELERRLAAEGAVTGVTFAEKLPRMYHDRRYVELDDGGAQPKDPRWPGYLVSSASVGLNYFDVLAAPILMGRGFKAADLTRDARVVIVNQSFVRLVLGGRNPIGRRLRRLQVDEQGMTVATDAPPGPWYEIIGVVRDLGMAHAPDPKVAGFYEPAAAGSVYPAQLAVHVRGDALSFAPRLRAIAAAVDPALRLESPTPVSQLNRGALVFIAFWFKLTVLVSAVALLLSLAGIYSVTSFAVSRRTREIGIRIALGANRRRVIASTFSRPLAQVGTGIVAGGALAATLSVLILGGAIWPLGAVAVAGYAALMMAVCSLACIVPTRRALSIEPSEALRA
jgi:putative ABC transport system permease protein